MPGFRPLCFRSIPQAQLPLQLPHILLPPPLPIDRDQAPCAGPALDRPGDVLPEQPLALRSADAEVAERGGEACHREAQVRELEELDGELGGDVDGEVHDAVVEVVALAVALHHVCELGVVDVVHLG